MSVQVLFQARLHPEQKANSLDAAEVKQLHDALLYVCKTAVEVDAESSQFPPDWLFHQRWDEKKAQPIHGNALEFCKSAGRVKHIGASLLAVCYSTLSLRSDAQPSFAHTTYPISPPPPLYQKGGCRQIYSRQQGKLRMYSH